MGNLLLDAKKANAECRRREENGMSPPTINPVVQRIFAMYGGVIPNGTDGLAEAIDAAHDESACGQMDGSESKSVLNSYLDKPTKAASNYSRSIPRNVRKTGEADFQSSSCYSTESAEAANSTNSHLSSKRNNLETPPRSVEDAVGAIESGFSTSSPLHAK